MAISHILGFPRIGPQRETKKAVESYWKGEINQTQLLDASYKLRKSNWEFQKEAGLNFVTVGDFSFYDHVLDLSTMLGVVPPRFGKVKDKVDLDTLFRMARGRAPSGEDAQACEMTKWFDTNYHYIVPEFYRDQAFRLSTDMLFDQVKEAKALGLDVKPVILGPLSYLWLGKTKEQDFDKLTLLDKLLPVYNEILSKLKSLDVEWVQIDEPILSLELPKAWQDKYELVFHELAAPKVKCLLATYFGAIDHNLGAIANLPIEGIHIDLIRGPQQLVKVIDRLSAYQVLSCGIVDGRNIWRNNLNQSFEKLEEIRHRIDNERLWVAPSCSLLHVPVDLALETELDPDLVQWLAFAKQKVNEVVTLAKALNAGRDSVSQAFDESQAAMDARANSPKIHKPDVKKRVEGITDVMAARKSLYEKRAQLQKAKNQLPTYPTTTIGSFPQTKTIRQTRRQFKAGDLTKEQYEAAIKNEMKLVVDKQEYLGLDVFVHGEPERNDMVEYFGELMEGFAFTRFAWVQSYGSRCVKPPIIFGDVRRPEAMTVEWTKYAQSLTQQPMKGMLTGPVTILCWSFVRDDQPRKDTTMQLALALRDEVCDLEAAGLNFIQIDEPAFREGLPLLPKDQALYLEWAVKAFKISVCGVQDETQIHTHMCYSEFNELIEYIAAMDADVISIEASRSDMELLKAFEDFSYPNEIGPGVYDIHSPQIPSVDEMVALLKKAAEKIPQERLWVNPDCGLKTRDWPETEKALKNMVAAAKILRGKNHSAVA